MGRCLNLRPVKRSPSINGSFTYDQALALNDRKLERAFRNAGLADSLPAACDSDRLHAPQGGLVFAGASRAWESLPAGQSAELPWAATDFSEQRVKVFLAETKSSSPIENFVRAELGNM